MIKILLLGGVFTNKGSEAMILCARTLLERCFGKVDLTVATCHKKRAKTDYYGLKIIYQSFAKKPLHIIKALIVRLLPSTISIFRDSVFSAYANANIIVDISGFRLTSQFGFTQISFYCADILLAKLLNKPYIIFPQDIGPFNTRLEKILVKFSINSVNLVMVRSNESKEYLKELSISVPVYICPDIALILSPETKEKAIKILTEKVSIPNLIVGIAPNMRIYEKHSDAYIKILTGIISYIQKKWGATAVLIPHEFRDDRNDDRFVIGKILSAMHNSDNVYAVTKEYTSQEFKAIIGQMTLLISSRYHCIVAGVSMRVPTFAIGWSHKYEGLMRSVGLEKFCVDFTKTELDATKELLDRLWIERNRIKRILNAKVEKLEQVAAKKPVILLLQSLKEVD